MSCQLDYTFDIYYFVKLLPKPIDFLHQLYRLLDLYTIYKALLGEIIERDISNNEKYKNEYEVMDFAINNIKNFAEIYIHAELDDLVDISYADEDHMWEILDRSVRKIDDAVQVISNKNTKQDMMIDNMSQYEKLIHSAYGII